MPAERVGRARIREPMIDDGPWSGVPIGGMGGGSIGRTYRGDFRRWHLTVGEHRVETIPTDAFSIHVSGGGRRIARVLAPLDGDTPREWGEEMPVGGGTYHALFPRAWFEYAWDDLPVRVVEEQLSPVIPSDYEASALPVGVFTWTLENPTDDALTVGLLLSWRDALGRERGVAGPGRQEVMRSDATTGIRFSVPASSDGMPASLAIAVEGAEGVAIGARLRLVEPAMHGMWADFADDGALEDVRPGNETGAADGEAAALSATFVLAPGERRRVRFAMAWDLPEVVFGGGGRVRRRHTGRWGTGGDAAFVLAAHAIERSDGWRAAIEAWQRPILDDPERPRWYAGALFNELYYLVDGGTIWTDDGDGGFGRFGLLECFDYPFYNTLDVDFYASWALLRLWPELERSVVREFVRSVDLADPQVVDILGTGGRAIRKLPGALPHDIGGPDEEPFGRPNRYAFRDPNTWKDLNAKFVLRVWRDVALLGDAELVREAWGAVRRALDFLAAMDVDGDGLPDHGGGPDQTYDTWPMVGASAYGGSLWLAALAAAVRLARLAKDRVAEGRYGRLLESGRRTFEADLWAGDRYRFDASGSDVVMADQLVGQWYADATGLGDVVRPDRVETALRTIHRLNVRGFEGGTMGPVNGMSPDGSVDVSSEQSEEVWVGTAYALAAFMIGRGLAAEGWETARGPVAVTYERGLWFRTPEAYDAAGNFRASLYLRPLGIWAIEEALERARRAG